MHVKLSNKSEIFISPKAAMRTLHFHKGIKDGGGKECYMGAFVLITKMF